MSQPHIYAGLPCPAPGMRSASAIRFSSSGVHQSPEMFRLIHVRNIIMKKTVYFIKMKDVSGILTMMYAEEYRNL